MQIEAAKPRRIENRSGKNEPIGDDDCGIERKRHKLRLCVRALQRFRRAQLKTMQRGLARNRRWLGRKPASLGTGRL